jgi:hypothetical protein
MRNCLSALLVEVGHSSGSADVCVKSDMERRSSLSAAAVASKYEVTWRFQVRRGSHGSHNGDGVSQQLVQVVRDSELEEADESSVSATLHWHTSADVSAAVAGPNGSGDPYVQLCFCASDVTSTTSAGACRPRVLSWT